MTTLAETIKADADRSLARHRTYEAVERIHAIPGVLQVTVMIQAVVAKVDPDLYGGVDTIARYGDTLEDALQALEQSVRDSYMAVL